MKKLLLPLFTCLFFNALSQNQRIYVHPNAGGNNDGSSWLDAYNNLQEALAVAQPGDSVWVAEGTYLPTGSGDRSISFRQKSGVGLYGGFAGTETSLAERNWAAHPAVLSGAIGSIFVSDNSLHILFLESPDSNTIVDGLFFSKAVEDQDTLDQGGGAIYIWAKDTIGTPVSAARIRNCRFESNTSSTYGAAVAIGSYGTDFTRFERCTFSQNNARFGGAVGISAGVVRTEFVDCQFLLNEALEGGGAVILTAPTSGVRFRGCLFEKNKTKNSGGGAVSHSGAGLPGEGVTFRDCRFLENVCESNSYPEGGAVFLSAWGGSDTLSFHDCIFQKNTGVKAGAVYIDQSGAEGSNFQFQRCRFEENQAANVSAIRLGCSGGCSDKIIHSFQISHCRFFKNKGQTVSLEGSAAGTAETLVQVDSSQFIENYQAAVFTLIVEGNSRLDVANSVFSKNKNGEVIVSLASKTTLRNCTVEENKQAYWLLSWEDGALSLRNCLFRNNETQDFLFGVNFGVLEVLNCHFDANKLVDDYPFPFFVAEATVSNSVFTGNTGTPYAIPSYLNPQFRHCYFGAALNNPPATLTLGPGILTAIDPLFANAAAGDFRLQPCSPLVAAGDNAAVADLALSFDGAPRIQGGAVDIGIFEKAPPELAAAPDMVAPCPGQSNGSIYFQPQNGCEPYSIAWASGTASGQNLDGLPAGDYVFSITDARGSVRVLPLVIFEKPAPVLSPDITPAHCGGTAGGSIVLNTGGQADFAYLWSDGSSDTTRNGLAEGLYPLTVTDAEGCSYADTVEVATQGRLKASVKIGKISCPGMADGSISVTPQNGLAPFHWQWSGGDTTAALAGLGAGWYQLTLTDALGCDMIWKIPLVDPPIDCIAGTSTVFPNPFAERLIVQMTPSSGETVHWRLTDALGRIVRSVDLTDERTGVDVSGLPAGAYYWQLWQGNTVVQAGKISKH